MAGNYWLSTQHEHWSFTKDQLASRRKELGNSDRVLSQTHALPDARQLGIFFHSQLCRLAKRLNVRQQALATAQVYIKRFYLQVLNASTDGTKDVLASSDVARIGECEFILVTELKANLIVHQPYRAVENLQLELGLTADEAKLAVEIINDHYMTDIPLLHAPHIIAFTAVLFAVVSRATNAMLPSTASLLPAPRPVGTRSASTAAMTLHASDRLNSIKETLLVGVRPSGRSNSDDAPHQCHKLQRLCQCLASSNVNIYALVDCIQEVISLYETFEHSQEKQIKDQVTRYVKSHGLDK